MSCHEVCDASSEEGKFDVFISYYQFSHIQAHYPSILLHNATLR